MKLEFSREILEKKKAQISNLIKILPVEAEFFFHADRRIDKYEEANSRFSQFCKRA
jgi:hypothetical protein